MRRFDLPVGAAPALLVVLSLVTSGWLLLHPYASPRDDATTTTLRVDVFARTHYDAYRAILPAFEASHPGVQVDLQLVHAASITSRLQAAFWADLEVPDLVECEISSVGMFFRGPLESIGFRDLTQRVHDEGLYARTVQARFSPWTSRGRIFGLPHDVHPVMLAYRRDLFEEEGIDPDELDTWDAFIEAGRKVTRDHDGDGVVDRYMLELTDNAFGHYEVLLFQRGGGFFDADGRLIMDDPLAIDTLRWYVPLVAGPDRIANTLGEGQVLTQAVESGYLLCMLCPDWRSQMIRVDMPRLAGKMALMPLPAFEPGGARTSTWGGTMVGITKQSPHPDLAWDLAMHLYYDVAPFDERFRNTNIIPPLRDAWDLPALEEPRPYWSGQRLGRLYTDLADETPPQYTSPFSLIAKQKTGQALIDCVRYYNQHGAKGFEAFVAETLRAKAEEVRAVMARNPF